MAIPEDSDAHLVTEARQGDRAALEALCGRWWPRMRRWALVELGDEVLADDAAQDGLVRVIRHLGSYDPRRPFGSWLRRLIRNACHDLRTKRGAVVAFDHDRGKAPGFERRRDLANAAERARKAFCALSPRQRQVVELVDHQGLSPSEAAAELGIAKGTARALLHQGRSALRKRLVAHRAEVVALLREAE